LEELEGAKESGQAVYARFCSIVGENVSYIQAALRCVESVQPKFVIGGCVAHTLYLMIEGVSKVAEICAIGPRVRDIVVFVKSHKYVQEMFDETGSPPIKALTLYPVRYTAGDALKRKPVRALLNSLF
jgi:hypothetical protein